MRILIAGGTGFLGRPLAAALSAAGHDVVARGRASTRSAHMDSAGSPQGTSISTADVDGAGAVVNLAGESIAGKRWTSPQKQRILESRVQATRALVTAIQTADTPPPVFISGSAVGYYGPLGDTAVTEDAPAGSDFLAGVCVQWEREALRAASDRTRVVLVRTGIVLEKDGGALPQMALPFRFGAGGRVGSGKQYTPWIHRDDWIALVQWAILTPNVNGAINATAPAPVTNADFARALGRAMHRPAFMPAPGFALKMLLGEMAEGLLLSGQRAVPAKATRLGFQFKYPTVDAALEAIFQPPATNR